MTDGMWHMSRPDLEARVAELEAAFTAQGKLAAEATAKMLELEAENKRLWGEPTPGAAMNALMEEESKESLAQLYLEAIGREKRLRECADAMALILERASSVLTGGCDCWYWPEMKIAAGKYRSSFPREEAKPTVIQPKSGPYDAKDVIDVKEAKP